MAYAVVGPDEIPRARQQVGEIERAGRFLERLITRRRAGELLLQARRKIGIRVLSELLEVAQQRVARSQHVRARGVLAELVADSLPRAREAAIARQIDEARLPAVEINLSERLLQLDLTAGPTDGVRVDEQVVARRRSGRGQFGE